MNRHDVLLNVDDLMEWNVDVLIYNINVICILSYELDKFD